MIEQQKIENIARQLGLLRFTATAVDPQQPFADWQQVSALVAQIVAQHNYSIVGLNGSQGSGKSTLAQIMVDALQRLEHSAAAVSLDDFYLPHSQRQTLAQSVHPLLATRGVPGTHDYQWLQRVLHEVRAANGAVTVPRFNKGQDDRDGTTAFNVDSLVLEGWCLGITPQAEADLVSPINALEREDDVDGAWRRWVNQQIQHYLPLWAQVDFWVYLRVPGFAQVLQWRTQAEQQIAPDLRMSAQQLQRFVQHYQRLTLAMWQQPPRAPGLVLTIAADHSLQDIRAVHK